MKNIFVALLCMLLVVTLISCNRTLTNDSSIPSLTTDPNVDTSTPASVSPVEPPTTNFQYELSENEEAVYINKYIGSSKNVVIPTEIDGLPVSSLTGTYVDGVNEGVFENSDIETVFIPASVRYIGISAFSGCTSLTKVTIAENSFLTYIGSFAFAGCIALTELSFAANSDLQRIGGAAFRGCTALTKIDLPGSVLEIGEWAFYECSSLFEIHLPENLETLGREAFAYCTALKKVTIPVYLDLYAIDSARFAHNPLLEEIIFEEGREKLDGYAFFAITSNAKITIPSSVKRFSTYPFFIYSKPQVFFLGDCPEIVEKTEFFGEPTIYYDPDTNGWDICQWRDLYSLIPIE